MSDQSNGGGVAKRARSLPASVPVGLKINDETYNLKPPPASFRGGIVMGIGMALLEEILFDERRGRIMNPSMAEYHVPVHLDVLRVEIIYNDIPDEHAPLGAHGVGESASPAPRLL